MMRGDAYSLPISIETDAGAATAESFTELEVSIGDTIRKTLSSREIKFDTERSVFLVPLTQEETFTLGSKARINVRCKYASGDVIGVDLGVLEFLPSLSREVL